MHMKTGGRPRHPDILTPRQWEVLELLRQGLTNEEIAQRLGITHDSAKFQVSEILGKLGVANRYEAASWRPEPESGRRRTWALAPVAVLHKLKWNALATAGAAAVTIGALAAVGLLIWGVGKTSTGGAGADAQAVVATATPGTETTPLVFDVATDTLRSLPIDGLF
ncbi:MAG TPA: LuxR C-terminal-related transcriptional regulator, partial [Dehalococcoidia bacterium]|nr:LuxR C-terminal-related transcriptional regulator [Dehalococcoidia bacterium]